MTLTTETGHQNFVVLLNVVQTTVSGDECGDLLAVLNQLNTNALSDGRVRLLSLDTDLFENNALCVRGTTKRIGLPAGT